MLRARTHVAGSRLMLRAQTHVARSIFFPPEIFQPTKQKPSWKIEPARCHWASTVAQNCIRIAFPVMLRAQSHVAGSIFFGNRFFFFSRGGSNLELARWVWVSTMNLSEHGESEWARWVWVSTGEVWVSTVSLSEQHGVPKFEVPPNLRFAVGDWAKISPD